MIFFPLPSSSEVLLRSSIDSTTETAMNNSNIEARRMDPFLQSYEPSELEIAAEFLTNWMPFITRGLCHNCTQTISDRVRSLDQGSCCSEEPSQSEENSNLTSTHDETRDDYDNCDCDTNSLGSWKDGAQGWSNNAVDVSKTGGTVDPPGARMSWADMAQEDELEEEGGEQEEESDPAEVGTQVQERPKLTWEQREYIRFMNVERKKDFVCFERVKGKLVNILDGLELHCGVFSAAEQKRIVDFVAELEEKGKRKELKPRTYTAPAKWMRGKGRVTIQFGCCYNYAVDKKGNPPGILRDELVDPIPHLFKVIIRRMVRWHVLPPSCVPDSCIVNIYEEGDCIPPHIDNHDFVRPFCTVSFLSECNILFGTNLEIVGPGEFAGSTAIPLPMGSVLVLNGNGADVAKHCVPAVPTKRISITFRKMDELKHPNDFIPEADLQSIQPLPYDNDETNKLSPKSPTNVNQQHVTSDSSSEKRRGDFLGRGSQSEPREPVIRDISSGRRRGFPGRGSQSESRESVRRHGVSDNRRGSLGRGQLVPRDHTIRDITSEQGKGILGSGSHLEPRESVLSDNGSEQRRGGFLGRGSQSEQRYTPVSSDNGSEQRRGSFLGRGGQSEQRYTPVSSDNGSEHRRSGFFGRGSQSEQRYPPVASDNGSEQRRGGFLGRGSQSEQRYTLRNQTQPTNKQRVRMNVEN